MIFFIQITFTQVNAADTNVTNHAIIAKLYEQVDKRQLESPVFDRALLSDSEQLQIMALKGLGRIGGEKANIKLLAVITDKNEKLRAATAFAIGISGVKSSSGSLWSLLSTENNEQVKQEIYLSLGILGENNVVNKLSDKENLA